ncbi:hypothetical protein COOONC_09093 [Cooperia oncophora]
MMACRNAVRALSNMFDVSLKPKCLDVSKCAAIVVRRIRAKRSGVPSCRRLFIMTGFRVNLVTVIYR